MTSWSAEIPLQNHWMLSPCPASFVIFISITFLQVKFQLCPWAFFEKACVVSVWVPCRFGFRRLLIAYPRRQPPFTRVNPGEPTLIIWEMVGWARKITPGDPYALLSFVLLLFLSLKPAICVFGVVFSVHVKKNHPQKGWERTLLHLFCFGVAELKLPSFYGNKGFQLGCRISMEDSWIVCVGWWRIRAPHPVTAANEGFTVYRHPLLET